MIVWVIAVACTFTGGLWLIISAIWPAPPNLSGAVTRLRAPGRPPLQLTVTADDSPLATAGRWALRHLRGALMLDQRTTADLELLRRPAELYAGSCMFAAVLGLLAGPAVWALATAAGAPIPILVPLWMLLVGSVIGWVIPRLVLRSQADTARADFRHALGAYLDVLVMLLAAQEGPESAMEIAANSGQGPAFDQLRRAIRQARLSGDPVWDTLDDLGQRVGVVELREIAAAGSLAGESGAAVRKSLTAKARSVRATSLSAAETAARQRSQQLFAPLVMMGFGFVIFLIYPLVTNISVGGT